MKKTVMLLVVAVSMMFSLGQASAQEVPQNYVSTGFSMGSGVSAWASTAGANGFGYMNFNPSGTPLVDSYVRNDYGSASVFARPWANGFVQSGEGGTGTVSSSFTGGASAGVQFTKENGLGTYTSISKSMSLSVSSSGNGSASGSGGFDVFVGANGNVPPVFVQPPVPTVLPTKG